MNGRKQSIQKGLGVLALAERLQNVSLACRLSSVSRAHYYRLKKTYEIRAEDRVPARSNTPFRGFSHMPREAEYVILKMTAQYPTIACSGLVMRLRLDGIKIPGDMVKSVWKKYGLTTRAARVSWMGKPDPWMLIEMQIKRQVTC
ncbi:hypothetical protein YTPLAS18_18740 [Nitrospira sp.]|nr:hypothetical protein YTPLAS18_18740 [Nitrospira sp.]